MDGWDGMVEYLPGALKYCQQMFKLFFIFLIFEFCVFFGEIIICLNPFLAPATSPRVGDILEIADEFSYQYIIAKLPIAVGEALIKKTRSPVHNFLILSLHKINSQSLEDTQVGG